MLPGRQAIVRAKILRFGDDSPAGQTPFLLGLCSLITENRDRQIGDFCDARLAGRSFVFQIMKTGKHQTDDGGFRALCRSTSMNHGRDNRQMFQAMLPSDPDDGAPRFDARFPA